MAEKPTMAELQQELAALRQQIDALTGRAVQYDPAEQADYVERGSDEHAAMLGLRKATEEDGEFVIDGWALDGMTNYPPSVTKEWLLNTLRQKINELTSEVPETQSVDPRKPGFAPIMWDPRKRQAFRRITE